MATESAAGGKLLRPRTILLAVGVLALLVLGYLAFINFSGATLDEDRPAGTTLMAGDFENRGHAASGGVELIAGDDGKMYLWMADDFEVDNGPDLFVMVSAHPTTDSSSDLGDEGSGHIVVQMLRAPRGSQVYEIDMGDEVFSEAAGSIAIHCVQYNFLFAAAPLS